MKRTLKIGFLSTFIFLAPVSVFAGAVSAGGMLASAKLECLFENPHSNLQPINFVIFNLGRSQNVARLEKFNLQAAQSVWAIPYDDSSLTIHGDLRYYSAGINDSLIAIKINSSRFVSEEQAKFFFAPLFKIKNTELVEGVQIYESELKFKGETHKGLCADGYFIFYGF